MWEHMAMSSSHAAAGHTEKIYTKSGRTMSTDAAKLQPWQMVNDADKRTAIRMLAAGASAKRIAAALGRTVDILYEWAQGDPAFARALNALAAAKDDAAEAYQTRVRRMADTMLDEIEVLATSTGVPPQVRSGVIKSFFADVHNPAVLPKVAAPSGPVVLISAEQAAILMAPSAPTTGQRSEGGSYADQPSQRPSNGGAPGTAVRPRDECGEGPSGEGAAQADASATASGVATQGASDSGAAAEQGVGPEAGAGLGGG